MRAFGADCSLGCVAVLLIFNLALVPCSCFHGEFYKEVMVVLACRERAPDFPSCDLGTVSMVILS